jgi:peroxiredoxin
VQTLKDEFDRRGVVIAVVSFAAPAKLADYQERRRWPFIMLADPDRIAYRAFGLKRLSWFRLFSPATIRAYWNLLRQGMKRDPWAGDDVHQAGGDFLLDREGNIRFAHRSQDPADRPPPASLLQAIDSIVRAP